MQPAGDKWTLCPHFGLLAAAFFSLGSMASRALGSQRSSSPVCSEQKGKMFFLRQFLLGLILFYIYFFFSIFTPFPLFPLFFGLSFIFSSIFLVQWVSLCGSHRCVSSEGPCLPKWHHVCHRAGLLQCVNMWQEPRDRTSKHRPASAGAVSCPAPTRLLLPTAALGLSPNLPLFWG